MILRIQMWGSQTITFKHTHTHTQNSHESLVQNHTSGGFAPVFLVDSCMFLLLYAWKHGCIKDGKIQLYYNSKPSGIVQIIIKKKIHQNVEC
jgi:hypothetical protein